MTKVKSFEELAIDELYSLQQHCIYYCTHLNSHDKKYDKLRKLRDRIDKRLNAFAEYYCIS